MSRPYEPRELARALADGAASARFLAGLLEQRTGTCTASPDAIERAIALASEPHTVVFVAVHHGNFPTLEYFAEVLRARGRKTVAIYLQAPAPDGAFDAVLSCDGSLWALAELLRRLPPRAIYLQAHGRWAFLSRWIDALHPGLRVVQEVWDWMNAFVDPARRSVFVDAGVFAADELVAILDAERWARQRTAAFVHKHGGPALDAIVADRRVPELRIHPCPPRAWMRAPVVRAEGPWRLVHTGQLKASTTSRAAFGDLHWLPMIRRLVAQDLRVTAYGGAGPSTNEYGEAARTIPGFTFHPRVEVRALVEALHGQHDFGVLLYDFDDDLAVGRAHLRTALASKLFVYLAAGLPVLVSPQLEMMASLVREHGVGLVVARDEVPTLASRLRSVDYAALQRAVGRAQQTFVAEHAVDDVLALLQQVSP